MDIRMRFESREDVRTLLVLFIPKIPANRLTRNRAHLLSALNLKVTHSLKYAFTSQQLPISKSPPLN